MPRTLDEITAFDIKEIFRKKAQKNCGEKVQEAEKMIRDVIAAVENMIVKSVEAEKFQKKTISETVKRIDIDALNFASNRKELLELAKRFDLQLDISYKRAARSNGYDSYRNSRTSPEKVIISLRFGWLPCEGYSASDLPKNLYVEPELDPKNAQTISPFNTGKSVQLFVGRKLGS